MSEHPDWAEVIRAAGGVDCLLLREGLGPDGFSFIIPGMGGRTVVVRRVLPGADVWEYRPRPYGDSIRAQSPEEAVAGALEWHRQAELAFLEATQQSRSFMALPWWQWRDGMRDVMGGRCTEGHGDKVWWPRHPAGRPKLDDDLTLHGIECMLRDQLGAVHVWCEPRVADWVCMVWARDELYPKPMGTGPDRASALLAACKKVM